MSVYRIAIDLTILAVVQRTKLFRNQIVVITIVMLVSIIGAVAWRVFWPLAGCLFIAPICGLFIWLDTRQVASWRFAVMANWARCSIDLAAFIQAMRAVPNLPGATLAGMLSLLGNVQVGKLEALASNQTRQAVVAVVQFADALGLQQLAVKVFAAAIVTVAIYWAAAVQAWQPLGLVVAALLLPPVLRWLQAFQQHHYIAAILAAKQHPDFDADMFRSLIEQLPLGRGLLLADIWVESESLQ
jgi:hypothetical protein